MNQPQNNKPATRTPLGRKAVFFLVFLPLLILFDFFYYWVNRSACLNCGDVGYFIQNSSISAYLIAQTVALIHKK